MGKDTSEEEFWMLCALTNMEEIDIAVNGEVNQEKVEEILSEFEVKPPLEIDTPKCEKCRSRMMLNNVK